GGVARQQHLEAAFARQTEQDARIVRVVLDDQQHPVVRPETLAIVRNLLLSRCRQHYRLEGRGRRGGRRRALVRAARVRGPDIVERQVEGEGAAAAGDAAEADLAAEQVRQLATDGKPQAGAAVLTRRTGVGLLERLEDDALLLGWDADARIAHRELHDRRHLAQNRVLGAPATDRSPDVQAHAAALGELEGVG